MTDDPMPSLLEAKGHSDNRRYDMKHRILAQMMKRNPQAFVIDSDDGKGIVGVTHVDTGFRLHVPRQVLPVRLEKAALAPYQLVPKSLLPLLSRLQKMPRDLPGTVDMAVGHLGKAVTKLNENPELEKKLRRALSYRLLDRRNQATNMRFGRNVGAAAGGLVGSITGGVTGAPGEDEGWSDRLKGTVGGGIIGALTGAAGGRAAGKHLPGMAQRGIGRVLTNLVDPVSYNDGEHFKALKGYKLKEMAKAVWEDKQISKIRRPTHVTDPSSWQKDAPRDAMFRDYFGLPRRKGTQNVFKQIGSTLDGGQLVQHNPATAAGKRELAGVEDELIRSVSRRGEGARHMQRNKPVLVNTGAMANFHINPDGSWSDTWDFAQNGGEKLDNIPNVLRAMITPFGTPSTIVGKTLSQSEALGRAGYGRSSAHPSFGPYLR